MEEERKKKQSVRRNVFRWKRRWNYDGRRQQDKTMNGTEKRKGLEGREMFLFFFPGKDHTNSLGIQERVIGPSGIFLFLFVLF